MKTLFPTTFAMLALVLLNLSVDRWLPKDGSSKKYATWRQPLSDWFWIRGYDAWLRKDRKRLLDDYSVATGLNPLNLTYWRLAAQTIAYDLPVWESGSNASAENRKAFGEEALRFFERSRPYFEGDPNWFIAGGFLAETAADDGKRALAYLAQAVALPDVPLLAGRNYARLLIKEGRIEDALTFLKNWQSELDQRQSEVRRSEIENWIHSLENQLKTPN